MEDRKEKIMTNAVERIVDFDGITVESVTTNIGAFRSAIVEADKAVTAYYMPWAFTFVRYIANMPAVEDFIRDRFDVPDEYVIELSPSDPGQVGVIEDIPDEEGEWGEIFLGFVPEKELCQVIVDAIEKEGGVFRRP